MLYFFLFIMFYSFSGGKGTIKCAKGQKEIAFICMKGQKSRLSIAHLRKKVVSLQSFNYS